MLFLLGATFASVMQMVGYILIALLCLMSMVVIHEFGHYLAGKLLGFKIIEFGVGFGPRIFKHTSKKTGEIFSIRPFPLGGFCQFEGEDTSEEAGKEQSEGAFNKQAPWKRIIVLFSGALFNFLSAIILIALVFTFYGQLLPTVSFVAVESDLARNSILQEGDVILEVDGNIVNILMQDDISRALNVLGDEGTLKILRDGKVMNVDINRSTIYERNDDGDLLLDEEGNKISKYAYGFSVGLSYAKLNFFRAFGRAIVYCFYLVYKILWLFGQLFTGALSFSESAGGPITVISTMSEATRQGLGTLLNVVCIISANLAVMNLLPLPALDGSRIVFTTIEWIIGRPVNRKVEATIHTVGFLLLFGFAIFADVLHFIN
ncbi:MAG: M50 family metallopeptidase [Clostridia bacterium]